MHFRSDGYSGNTSITASTTKAMLLNKVVVGKGAKLTALNTSLTQPPSGYDSVLGGSGIDDELIVYTEDAIRPSFLVIYQD